MALTPDFGAMLTDLQSPSLALIVSLACHAGLIVVLGLICRSDIAARRVGNRLIGLVALLGLIEVQVTGTSWAPGHLVTLLAASGLLILIWQMRMIGGADVKLILACLVWIEPPAVLAFAVLVTTLGALLGMAVMATRGAIAAATRRRVVSRDTGLAYLRLIALRDRFLGPHDSVPYAVAIALAQLATLIVWPR